MIDGYAARAVLVAIVQYRHGGVCADEHRHEHVREAEASPGTRSQTIMLRTTSQTRSSHGVEGCPAICAVQGIYGEGCPQYVAVAENSCGCQPYHVDSGKTYLFQVAGYGNDDNPDTDRSGTYYDDANANNDVTVTWDYQQAPSYDNFASPKTLPSSSGTMVVPCPLEGSYGSADPYGAENEEQLSYKAISLFRNYGGDGFTLESLAITTRSGFVFWVHDSGRVFLSRSRTDYSNANNSVVASVGSPSRHHFERTQL